MLEKITEFVKKFLETENNSIHVISHYDTDGITSATIFSKTLEKLDKSFSVKILKQLTEKEINQFPKDKTIVILDLGSSHLPILSKLQNKFFIIDHHEIPEKNQNYENINIINPHLYGNYENLCAAELTYLVSKEISKENEDLAYLAIMGMIGDTLEKNITKHREMIIKDSKVKVKKGFLLYPSTRPLDKAIEFSSNPFIPGATGDYTGAIDLLTEAKIERTDKNFKSLIDLNSEEMKNLTTAILLRLSSKDASTYLGNLYLIKFFNKIEDARELSAIINACSRIGYSETSFLMCMGNATARKKAEKIYVKYRQHIISGLKFIDKHPKIQGREYIIINAQDKIKDTIIGTLASILSFSSTYKEGTIIIAMAYNEEKIKVSARLAGRNSKNNRNLKELITSITHTLGGESGGHKHAAGCTIDKEHENKFIDLIKKKLEFELIKA